MHERKIFEKANALFWDKLEAMTPPLWTPHRYDMVAFVQEGSWRLLADTMVADELQETINLLNGWAQQLFNWSVWIEVLEVVGNFDECWTLRMHHVDLIAFFCMYQPSAMRDRLGLVATNGIHQANLASDKTYVDHLELDDLPQGRFPSRKQREDQLAKIGPRWKAFEQFQMRLQEIDQSGYRLLTRNYRNRSSHSIAPRFEWGETNFVSRTRGAAEDLVAQADGSYQLVKHPTRKSVSYGFGGAPALKYAEMFAASRAQFSLVERAVDAYEVVLAEVLTKIGTRSDLPRDDPASV